MPMFLTATGGTTMQELITNQITPMVTYVTGQLPAIGEAIATDPVLGLTLGILVVGGVIGLFGRLIHRG